MVPRTQVFAHRGAKSVAPENTLPAFAKALEMGVDGIELDVQCTKDGRLAILHDFDLSHTTTGTGRVADYTAEELAQFDAGSHFDEAFAGTPIPTLDQVLDLVGDSCLVNVEIKSDDAWGGAEIEPLAALIRRRRLYEQVIVSSFNPVALIKMRWVDPNVALGLLYSQQLPVYLRRAWLGPLIAPEALHPHYTLIDAEYVRWARSQGHYVNTWTVNQTAEACRLADLGVDALISDVPDQLMVALRTTPTVRSSAQTRHA